MVGNTVGQYRITGSIGAGGMGAVYSAVHVLLGRPAAVKLLLPEVSSNPEIVDRFFNEARAAAAILHPGIVEVYDFGWHSDGSAYLVMEHLQGESLAARSTRGRMAPVTVMTIARQIASALAVVHGKGIVHRDLKPDNIFLVRDSEVISGERIKLLDFGIAKIATGDDGRKTRAGTILGTPNYMAPEQCRGMAVDHRADLYALGCVLFELCTGRPPFSGAGDGEVLAAHIHLPASPVSSVVRGLPAALTTLIDRLLSKDRERRLQSAEAVVQAMDSATGLSYRSSSTPAVDALHEPLHTTLSASASMVSAGARGSRRRGWLRSAALGMLAVIAAVAIGALEAPRDMPAELSATGAAVPRAATREGDRRSMSTNKVVAAREREVDHRATSTSNVAAVLEREIDRRATSTSNAVAAAEREVDHRATSTRIVAAAAEREVDRGATSTSTVVAAAERELDHRRTPPSNVVAAPEREGDRRGAGVVAEVVRPRAAAALPSSRPGHAAIGQPPTAASAQPSSAQGAAQRSTTAGGGQRPKGEDATGRSAAVVPRERPRQDAESVRAGEAVAVETSSSDSVAAQYAAVGLQLIALRQHRSTADTADLWSRYLSIHINDALVDPARRAGVAETLRQLRDQIAELAR